MADRPDPLLRAADIAAMEGLAKTHFLNPRARRVNKSLGDATGLTGLGIHLIEVQPGDVTTEHHVHYHEDEAIYVLSGTAEASYGDTVQTVGPGDFLGYAAGGEAHSLVATGDAPLRCLVIGQRLDHDVADYPRKAKRIFRNIGFPYTLVDHDALETVQAGRKR
ncbi:MAG: cupin domain-containing protein [Pseudomonadota bacterium]